MTLIWTGSILLGIVCSAYVAIIGVWVLLHGGPAWPARILTLNAMTWGILLLAMWLLKEWE